MVCWLLGHTGTALPRSLSSKLHFKYDVCVGVCVSGLATKGPGGVRMGSQAKAHLRLSWTLQDQGGNLLPNRKFRNLSSPNILQKSQESRPQPMMIQRKSRENPMKIPGFVVPRLGQLSLLGEKEPQSRLLQATCVHFCHISCQTRHMQYTQVYNLVGSLYCEHVVPLYFPVRG